MASSMGIRIHLVAIPVLRRIVPMLAIRITGNQQRAGRALAFDSPAQWFYRASGLANGGRSYSRRQLLAKAAIAASRVGSNLGARPRRNAVFSVTSERALGPFGKRLRRYVPRRIVHRRRLCASVICRMDARHLRECPLERVPYSFRIDWPRSLSLRACSQPIAETAPIGAYRRSARARSPFRGPRKDI